MAEWPETAAGAEVGSVVAVRSRQASSSSS